MATLFITAKPRYMPDEENEGKWVILPEGFYYQKVDVHHIFLHECLPKDGKIPKSKHSIVAAWIDTIITYSEEMLDGFCPDEFFLIVHDEDLLRYKKNDEGLLRESEVVAIAGGLQMKVKDRHIYVFMHRIQHVMFEALIKDLIDIEKSNIEAAIRIIKECTYETSVS